MIIVLLVVFIAMILIGSWLIEDCHPTAPAFLIIGGVGFIVSTIALIILVSNASTLNMIDEKIEMLQEENSKIESQIAETVSQYQEYESGVFTEIAPESAITLVAVYPELKADALVQKQIEVYLRNNEAIKELKMKKLYENLHRWWLYFGGRQQ